MGQMVALEDLALTGRDEVSADVLAGPMRTLRHKLIRVQRSTAG